jgi:hypothetical protein
MLEKSIAEPLVFPEITPDAILPRLEQQLFAGSEWRILDSIYAEIGHEITRLDEIANSQACEGGAFTYLLEFKESLDE